MSASRVTDAGALKGCFWAVRSQIIIATRMAMIVSTRKEGTTRNRKGRFFFPVKGLEEGARVDESKPVIDDFARRLS
jgi:hypothetical protein